VENAAELDETLDQLNYARRDYERASTRDTSERSPTRVFELGSRFIVGWQKFLVYRASGNVGMAKLAVQELARTAETEPLYPHARLLEMTELADQPPKGAPAGERIPAEKILASIKTLDDIEPNLEAFKKAAEADMDRFHTVDNDLETLMTAAAAVKHGDFSRTSMALFGGFNRHPKIPELRQQLALQMMAGILDAKGEDAPKPSETAKQFAHRLANDARDRKAWGRLRQILEAPARYHPLSDTFAPSDTGAVRSFMAGQNMEDAAVWQQAASSYIEALKTGSTFIPIDAIKQRLEGLRRDHPQDYARAVEQSSNFPKTP
jgi:hypothetical protein